MSMNDSRGVVDMFSDTNRYNSNQRFYILRYVHFPDSNVRRRRGPDNARFISIRQVSLPVDFAFFCYFI